MHACRAGHHQPIPDPAAPAGQQQELKLRRAAQADAASMISVSERMKRKLCMLQPTVCDINANAKEIYCPMRSVEVQWQCSFKSHLVLCA